MMHANDEDTLFIVGDTLENYRQALAEGLKDLEKLPGFELIGYETIHERATKIIYKKDEGASLRDLPGYSKDYD